MKYTVISLTNILFQWFLMFLWLPTTCSQMLVDVHSQPIFQTYQLGEGKVLNKNHVTRTFQSDMLYFTCMMECASHMDCYSMNIYPARGVCELNNATHLSNPDDSVDIPGGQFLLYFLRSIGWCSDKLCAGTGKRCFLNPDQASFKCLDFCSDALGLQDRRIPDSALTASSSYPSSQATSCRLMNQDEWGVQTNQIGQYLQVDLNGIFKVTGVATQGHVQNEFWVTEYKVAYRTNEDGQQEFYKENGLVKIFDGNVDKTSVVTKTFTESFVARYVRIVVQSWNGWTAMRAELYGCRIN